MRVILGHSIVQVAAHDALARSLERRDSVGGAEFWIELGDEEFPCVAMRISGAVADVHYFAAAGEPGFRALNADEDRSEVDSVRFVYEGCDPSSGEDVPCEFVLPVGKAVEVVLGIARTGSLPTSIEWLEL